MTPLSPSASRALRRVGWVLLATALGVGLTSAAGFWQLGRARTKQALHDTIVSRQALPALGAGQLPCNAAGWQGEVQRQARVQGHWLPGRQVWLDNRSMDGRAGFFLLQAFELEPSPGEALPCAWRTLLVQRGWAPRDPSDRTRLPDVPSETSRVALQGRLIEAPARVYELGSGSPEAAAGPLRQNVSVSGLAAQWGVALSPGTMLQLEPTEPRQEADARLERRWWQPQADVGKHRAYALQWFAMAAVMLGLFLWFQVWRRFKPARGSGADTPAGGAPLP